MSFYCLCQQCLLMEVSCATFPFRLDTNDCLLITLVMRVQTETYFSCSQPCLISSYALKYRPKESNLRLVKYTQPELLLSEGKYFPACLPVGSCLNASFSVSLTVRGSGCLHFIITDKRAPPQLTKLLSHR